MREITETSLHNKRAWLLALCAVAGVGCTEGSSTQVLTGRITTSGALAVRAVSADSTVTATQVRSNGSFTLALPAGQRYRLEVLTTSGVRHVLSHTTNGFGALSFQVCEPTDPWDVGGVGDGTMDPNNGGGGGPGPCTDPSDPNCKPLPCTDPMDPTCGCDASGACPPPPCQPGDPNCGPPCADPSDPNCMPPPPPCADPSDPSCKPPEPCQPGDPSCGTTCTDPMDPGCMPPPPICTDPTDPYCKCDANGACPPPTCNAGDPMCPPEPPPPCADPTDPTTCNDPCKAAPASCGCGPADPNCWPPPQPPECSAAGTMCDPGMGGMTPDHPPGDFGCKELPPT